ENKSVAFAETIGSLYYENGQPGDMVKKKIKYFLIYLKKQYRFDKITLDSNTFREQAALRLNLSKSEIDKFFNELLFYQKKKSNNTQELKELYKTIENFKQKINSK